MENDRRYDMRPNKLRELLKSNKPTLSTHIHTTWPSVVEAIGHTGLYDYVEFVGEYGPFDLHDLDNLARAGDIYNMSMQLKVDQEPRGFLAQRAIRRALFAPATSGGVPRVRNGHQDGRAAPRRDRHRGSGEVLPRHGRPAFFRRHRHHDPAPVVEIPGGGPAQGSRPLTHLRA